MLKMFIMARALLHAAQYEEARLTAKALLGEVEVVDFDITEGGIVTSVTCYDPVEEVEFISYKNNRPMQIFIDRDPYWGFDSMEGDWVCTPIGNVVKEDTWKHIVLTEINK